MDDFGNAYKTDFRNALKEYKDYLKVNRYFPQGERNRGQFSEQQDETDIAIEAYESAIQRDPRFNPARINLAYFYNGKGQNDEAERLLRKVIEQETENGDYCYGLLTLYMQQEQYEKALEQVRHLQEINPNNTRIQQIIQTIQREM